MGAQGPGAHEGEKDEKDGVARPAARADAADAPAGAGMATSGASHGLRFAYPRAALRAARRARKKARSCPAAWSASTPDVTSNSWLSRSSWLTS